VTELSPTWQHGESQAEAGRGAVGVVKRARLGDLEDTMTTEQRGPDPQQPRTRARTRSDTAQRRRNASAEQQRARGPPLAAI
jgi:hypothetical protein